MLKRSTFITSLVLVAIFAFAFGLSFVNTVQAGPNPCCEILPNLECSGGVGVWKGYAIGCVYEPENDSCLFQIAPDCW